LSNSDSIQKFKFKSTAGNCFVLQGSHKAANSCFGANLKDCKELEFYSQENLANGRTQDISHGEIIFACCGTAAAIPPSPVVVPPALPAPTPTVTAPEEVVIPREDTESEGEWESEPPPLPPIVPCSPVSVVQATCGTSYTLYWAKTTSATAWASSPGPGQ
jgi:hypothetical protein